MRTSCRFSAVTICEILIAPAHLYSRDPLISHKHRNMARTFQNPANNHEETVSASASMGAFFLGWIYLAFKGLWGHFFIWLLAVGIPAALVDRYTFILTIPLLSIFYGLAIQGILSTRYLRRGWREIGRDEEAIGPSTAQAAPLVAPISTTVEPAQLADSETKTCPYCAETIKTAAIRCKHCRADLAVSSGEPATAQ